MKLLDKDVLPVFHLAGTDATVHNAYKPGHARELVAALGPFSFSLPTTNAALDLNKVDALVCVGGDGLLHEVIARVYVCFVCVCLLPSIRLSLACSPVRMLHSHARFQ